LNSIGSLSANTHNDLAMFMNLAKSPVTCVRVVPILAAMLMAGPAGLASAGVIDWTSWTSNSGGTMSTPAGTISVGYSGELSGLSANYPSWNPSSTFADGVTVANPPPQSGSMIRLVGGSSTVDTLTFSSPVLNPVLSIWSLGQPGISAQFVFNNAAPTLLSGGPSSEYGGGSIAVSGNTVTGNEGNGTIAFSGLFSSISWSNPVYENYYGFTVGVPAVPEPGAMTLLGMALTLCAFRPSRNFAKGKPRPEL
jgi:hypothetical protein